MTFVIGHYFIMAVVLQISWLSIMSKKLGFCLMTVCVVIECPHCHSTEVTKNGKSPVGKQRYRCQNSDCPYRSFVLTQTYPGRNREVKQQIVEMTLTCLWGERYCTSVTRQSHNSKSGIKNNSHTSNQLIRNSCSG